MSYSKFTGLELMKMMVAGDIPSPSMSITIPMKAIEATKGRVVFTAKADSNHLNPTGMVHGGFAATVLDTVTACAIQTMLGRKPVFSTIELNVKMMRPMPIGVELLVQGDVINVSKSLGISEGKIFTPEGKLIAHATCTCFIKSHEN